MVSIIWLLYGLRSEIDIYIFGSGCYSGFEACMCCLVNLVEKRFCAFIPVPSETSQSGMVCSPLAVPAGLNSLTSLMQNNLF